MEKGEWVKHMLFLYLQVPYDENITLGTREYGVQLNIITELRKVGEQKGRKLTQPTHKNKKRKNSSATKWARFKYLLKCLQLYDISF